MAATSAESLLCPMIRYVLDATLGGFCGGGSPEPAVPAAAPAAAPPTAEQVAREAIGQLRIPEPVIGIGPDFDKVAVNLWNWLWIEEPEPITLTVTAGSVSVTAVAELSETVWSMGEPIENPDLGRFEYPPPLVCQGPGEAPVAGEFDWRAEPPCGYMYRWRSDPARTHGEGTWPVSVMARWTVSWTASTGQSGSDTLTATSSTAVEVGEYRILLVPN